MRETVERWLGTLFGLILLSLSLIVTVETIVRKVFNFSLQGADELGGYSLAVGATIAFSLALMGRTHIRVDVFHDLLPTRLQTVLNLLSILGVTTFALLMAWLSWFVIQDTRAYHSVSQTPWATPLVIPQSAWLAGLIVFAVVSVVFTGRALLLLLRGRSGEFNRDFGPRAAREDVAEELQDLALRSGRLNAASVEAPAP